MGSFLRAVAIRGSAPPADRGAQIGSVALQDCTRRRHALAPGSGPSDRSKGDEGAVMTTPQIICLGILAVALHGGFINQRVLQTPRWNWPRIFQSKPWQILIGSAFIATAVLLFLSFALFGFWSAVLILALATIFPGITFLAFGDGPIVLILSTLVAGIVVPIYAAWIIFQQV